MNPPLRPDDIDQEIEFHLQETVDALVASGMDAPSARAEASRRFGRRTHHAAVMALSHRESLSVQMRLASLWSDLVAEVRSAAKNVWRAPAYALTVIATLALASGANLTVFGIMDGLTFRPLRYLRAPGDVDRVYWQWTDQGHRTTTTSAPYTRFLDLTRGARSLADVAAFAEQNLPVGEGTLLQQRPVAAISASYFRFFDAKATRGRFFSEAEDATPRGADVAILSDAYWRATFAGGDVLGRALTVGNIHARIIGVAPAGFDGLNDGRSPDVFVPITTYAASTGTGDAQTYFSAYKWGWVQVLVRRATGVTAPAASADVTRLFRDSWAQSVADNPTLPPVAIADARAILAGVRTGAGPTAGSEARTALWLFALSGAVFLIGCANVANLAVSRSLARRRDVRVRRALGITTRRLLLGVAAESALLAAAGGLAALAVAEGTRIAVSPLLRSFHLADLSVFDDHRTLAVTAIAAGVAATLMAWLPAILLRKTDQAALRGTPRGATDDGARMRAGLLIIQATLSVTLLVGAGLFVRSLLAIQSASLGYDPGGVLLVSRQIPQGGFDAATQTTIRRQLLEQAQAMPDVEAAAWMSSAPFVSTSSTDIYAPGVANATALGPFTFQATTADYFRAMRTRIVRGRALLASDTEGTAPVGVVSESMARTLWPGRDAIGQCFHMRTADSPCREVVGIAEDIVQQDIAGGSRLHYYVPIEQYARTFGNGLLLRLRDPSGTSGEGVRRALQQGLPAGYYLVAQRLSDVVVDQQASWRIGTAILVGFAVLALCVAGVGLFGSVRYDITQRSREWAVRVALGASRPAIARLIVLRSLWPVSIGIAVGLVLAAALGHWLRPLLYRTSPFDPVLFWTAAMLMTVVSIAASTRPAVLAARTDPQQVLRNE